ncbi:hypothetical protein EVG20_g880 [Dentipellis fragilis]|uniref:Uncharacterized protein n=1 Tax=Dentipellis fragilis TaxID=205917 RepID=A0A4Y9ZCB5_9AGAM|nr:hypothetical protein EVG20_g880 [Dentipellis fragilis]
MPEVRITYSNDPSHLSVLRCIVAKMLGGDVEDIDAVSARADDRIGKRMCAELPAVAAIIARGAHEFVWLLRMTTTKGKDMSEGPSRLVLPGPTLDAGLAARQRLEPLGILQVKSPVISADIGSVRSTPTKVFC